MTTTLWLGWFKNVKEGRMQINKLGPFKLILRGKQRTLLAFVLLREHIYTPLLSVNEMINVKYLTQCLAHRKHPIYGCCYLNTYCRKRLYKFSKITGVKH